MELALDALQSSLLQHSRELVPIAHRPPPTGRRSAHLPVVVQIKDASVPDLKERIAHAWTRLFAEIPSMSVTLHSPQPHSPPAAPTKTHASNAAPPAGRSENAVQTTTSPFSSAADYIKSLVPLLMSTSLATTLLVWLLTTTAKRKKAGFVEARYSTEATKEVTDKWLRDTLRFREMKDVASTAKSSQEGLDAAEAAMRDLTSELIAEGISHEATGLVGLDAVFFAQGYVGLGLRFHHSNFDGTAIYLMLDELLSRLSTTPAHPRKHTFPLRKPDPTPVAIQSIPTSKFDADYAKDLRGYISKSITVAASSPTTPTAPIHYTGHVRQARHTFSASETATLLAAAKKTGVTISQIAAILHLVPLVKRRPPKRPAKDQVAFQTTINVRDTIGIKERFFGNAFLMPDNPVPASVVTGPSLDRKGVLDAAQAVTKELNYQKENGIWIGAFMEYTLNVLLDTGATVLPQNPFTVRCASMEEAAPVYLRCLIPLSLAYRRVCSPMGCWSAISRGSMTAQRQAVSPSRFFS